MPVEATARSEPRGVHDAPQMPTAVVEIVAGGDRPHAPGERAMATAPVTGDSSCHPRVAPCGSGQEVRERLRVRLERFHLRQMSDARDLDQERAGDRRGGLLAERRVVA